MTFNGKMAKVVT